MKTGPTFVIPPDKANELILMIEELNTDDPELLGFADHLRMWGARMAYVCVAEEDFVLWPGGPDIRDYQIGGRNATVHLIHRRRVYSNDPADLPSRRYPLTIEDDSFLKQSEAAARADFDCPDDMYRLGDECVYKEGK